MKTIILILIMSSGLYIRSLSAAESSDYSVGQDSAKQVFIDENQNGIDDRNESKDEKGYRGRRDRFVDKDGDGICDEREGCIGPKHRHRGGRNGKK